MHCEKDKIFLYMLHIIFYFILNIKNKISYKTENLETRAHYFCVTPNINIHPAHLPTHKIYCIQMNKPCYIHSEFKCFTCSELTVFSYFIYKFAKHFV